MPTPTAVLVVVGSEVLSAKVVDENGPWAARRLRELGVRLLAIYTVPDWMDAVVDAVDRARQQADWVFTSGGVGPTHDDLTVAAVARLLGDAGYPTLMAANVVMLPGVPQFFRFQFDRIAHLLEAPPFRLACVFLSAGEGAIAPALDRVAHANPLVEIGSYPRFDEADHRVMVTIESKDAARVAAALAALLAELPAGSVIRTEGP